MPTARAEVRSLTRDALAFLDSPTIAVAVGTNARSFSVHESLISSNSAFFQNALKEPWKEAHDRVVSLPADDPEAFRLCVQYLYSGKLFVKQLEPNTDDGAEWTLLAKLYVLCEKLLDEKAQVVALKAMHDRAAERHELDSAHTATLEAVRIIYEGTPKGSSARDFFIDLHTQIVVTCEATEQADTIPPAFFRDLAHALLVERPLLEVYEAEKAKVNIAKTRVSALEQSLHDTKAQYEAIKQELDDAKVNGLRPQRSRDRRQRFSGTESDSF